MEYGVKPTSPAEVDDRNLFLDQAVSGSIGGVASAMVTNPLEMLRIRLQVIRMFGTTYKLLIFRYIGPLIGKRFCGYGSMKKLRCSPRVSLLGW